MNKKGFTLTEIMIVVMIIGILCAFVIPNIRRSFIGANETFAQSTLSTIGKALEIYYVEHSSYPTDIEDLFWKGYIRENYFETTGAYTFTGKSFSDSYLIIAKSGNLNWKIFRLSTGNLLEEVND